MTTNAVRVGGNGDVILVVPVCDTNAYASGDLLFVPIEVPDAVRELGGRAFVQTVRVLDESDQASAMDLLFMSADGSLGTINGALNPTDAIARNIQGIVSIGTSDYSDLINSQLATKNNIGLMVEAEAGTRSLWLAGVVRSGTPTYAAAGLRIRLGLMWD